jgi:hypothetical protein
MIRFTLLILILFSIITGSCSSRKNKLEHRDLIPEKDLIAILTDVHIADGLLNMPHILHFYAPSDSLSAYNQIINQHGYTKETMDKTMKYYFIKKPKELIKIYDQVLGILSEMETYLDKEAGQTLDYSWNLWTGREYYFHSDTAGTKETMFDIELNRPGIYNLTFSATIFPDDQSVNPKFTAYTCHPDSVDTGKREYINTINYIKDGLPHNYTIIIRVPIKKILHLRGWLYDFENNPDEWDKHVIFRNISVIFTSAIV